MKWKNFVASLLAMVVSGTYSPLIEVLPLIDEMYVSAEELTYGDLTYFVYRVSDGYGENEISVTGCDETAINVEIPKEIDGIPVTAISSEAFRDCTNLETVTIPDTVSYINLWAFFNCTSLTTVELSSTSSLTAIGNGAFENCSSLETITIPDSVQKIEEYAFSGCSSLKSITFPDSVQTIWYDSFSGCNSVEHLEIGAGLDETDLEILLSSFGSLKEIHVSENSDIFSSIDGVLFSKDKTELIRYPSGKADDSYVIDDFVTVIAENAFYNCDNLISIKIPNSVTSIGNSAFTYCNNLTSMQIPDSVTDIGGGVFYGCSSLNNVKLSNNIVTLDCATVEIGYGTYSHGFFEGCKSLTSINIPEGVVSIGENAFRSCVSLQTVELPDSVKEIAINAFRCGTVGYPEISDSLLSVTVPKELVTLDLIPTAFYGDTNFVLRYNRDELDYKTIANIENKINIISKTTVPMKNGSVLYSTNKNYISSNNGYLKSTDSLHEVADAEGNVYAVCANEGYVTIVPQNQNESSHIIANDGFQFGAATFDDENHLYILWYYVIPVDEYRGDEENIVLKKYNKKWEEIDSCALSVANTHAQFPLSTYGANVDTDYELVAGAGECGNANIVYSNGVIGCFYDTQWDYNMSADGVYHQGSNFTAIDTDTMSPVYTLPNEGSHSEGVMMIPTDYGFAAIQYGDFDRGEYGGKGINFNCWGVNDDGSITYSCLTRKETILEENGAASISGVNHNGEHTIFHESGQALNEGETTVTIIGNQIGMGGLAKSISTYAFAGKSKRSYSSESYNTLNLENENENVFVKLFDQTLCDGDFAGEDRIDLDTGEVADRSVVWLTECTDTEKAGEVKIVTLEDGSYCVLWEKFINGKFDSVRYVILDECGYVLRQETEIQGARLSCTSIQPIVQGNTLTWAVADAKTSSINWYTVDLDELVEKTALKGDINCDNEVDVLDVLALNKNLLTGEPLSEQGTLNADVDLDGKPTSMDALNILKFTIHLIEKLPV